MTRASDEYREETHASPHFTLSEFAVSASRPDLVRPVPDALRGRVRRLATRLLEPLRAASGSRLKIVSGYRPPPLNKAVGGSPTSQHVVAEAVDVVPLDVPVFALWREVLEHVGAFEADLGQAIVYPARGFVHLALPSVRFPAPSLHLHAPPRFRYHRVREGDVGTWVALWRATGAPLRGAFR